MIRKATQADAREMADLIMIIWRAMDLEILKKYPEELLRKILVEAICTERYRFSYRNTIVYASGGKVVGLLCGYRGILEPTIDAAWYEVGHKYGLTMADKVFIDRESFAGEWYIDSIVIDSKYRGRGIATQLLTTAKQLAVEAGETVLGLNCDIRNLQAKKLYERIGFVPMMEMQLSGHIYYHMQKLIEE